MFWNLPIKGFYRLFSALSGNHDAKGFASTSVCFLTDSSLCLSTNRWGTSLGTLTHTHTRAHTQTHTSEMLPTHIQSKEKTLHVVCTVSTNSSVVSIKPSENTCACTHTHACTQRQAEHHFASVLVDTYSQGREVCDAKPTKPGWWPQQGWFALLLAPPLHQTLLLPSLFSFFLMEIHSFQPHVQPVVSKVTFVALEIFQPSNLLNAVEMTHLEPNKASHATVPQLFHTRQFNGKSLRIRAAKLCFPQGDEGQLCR